MGRELIVREDENSPALRKGVDYRGTPNAIARVTEYVRPGKKRAPFLRYIRINLPRTVRVVLLAVIAAIGASAATVALSDYEPFAFADVLLWAVLAAAIVVVAIGLATKLRVWTAGLGVALAALLIYIGGIFGTAPFVWNGASIVLAAVWNLVMIASVVYLLLYWALNYGMIVAAPDNQNFMD